MLQITSKNFNKRRMKIEVHYGKKIQEAAKEQEHVAESLYERFKESKKVEIHMDFKLGHCAICESTWKSGDFAIEKLMLVPTGKGQKSVTVTIPRVVCHTCSKTMSDEDQESPAESALSSTLGTAWRVFAESLDKRGKPKSKPNSKGPTPHASPSIKPTYKSKITQNNPKPKGPALARSPPVRHAPGGGPRNMATNATLRPSPNLSSAAVSTEGVDMVTPQMSQMDIGDSAAGDVPEGAVTGEAGVNQSGFLVCTQLVKTGGADKAGLQVGDIFQRLGYITKENFHDLKEIANYIRRSANQSIEAVVFRKQAGENRGARGAVFHRIKLQLTPLQSHDADGGGVLGAVMNLWPEPKPRHGGS